jgi:hypothetical protein
MNSIAILTPIDKASFDNKKWQLVLDYCLGLLVEQNHSPVAINLQI